MGALPLFGKGGGERVGGLKTPTLSTSLITGRNTSYSFLNLSPRALGESGVSATAENSTNLEQSRFGDSKNLQGRKTLKKDIYDLETYRRSNQDTCLMHRPALTTGEWVESGDLIADNTASMNGELAIGKNILVAYMPWEGYNYEDSILINERLVYDDTYTSVHIERYEIEIREGQQGAEQITKDIPDLNSSETAHLDDSGIVKIGSWIEEGTILVGKVTPANPKKQTGYQRLIFKLFDKKVASLRDSSLRAPKGMKANVISVHILDYALSDTLTTNPQPKLKKLNQQGRSSLKQRLAEQLDAQRGGLGAPQPVLNSKRVFIWPATFKGNVSEPRGLCRSNKNLGASYLKRPRLRASEPPNSSSRETNTNSGKAVHSLTQNKFCSGWKSQGVPNPGFFIYLATGVPEPQSIGSAQPLKDRTSATLSRCLTNQRPYSVPNKNQTVYYDSSYALQKKLRQSKMSAEPPSPSQVDLPTLKDTEQNLNLKAFSEQVFLRKTLGVVAPPKQNTKLVATNVHIYLAEKRKIQVGDKMAGRHGNKGIISNILPRQDMPYLPDGTALDIVLNPLGVPSRMNVGQIYECLLGLAGRYLGEHYKVFSFDELYGAEASRSFVFGKLFEARQKTGIDWLFNPDSPGKIRIFDGRTDECFDQPVTVGIAYMLKLVHMVDDKIHARSTGPYSLVTQQPLRGRAKQGGQRLGEMEVWAIEGFGAAFVLLEMLTLKSDDMTGRLKLWSDLILNHDITIGTPESFKVLVCELQALCLDIGLYTKTARSAKRLSSKVGKSKSKKDLKNKPFLKKISHLMFMP